MDLDLDVQSFGLLITPAIAAEARIVMKVSTRRVGPLHGNLHESRYIVGAQIQSSPSEPEILQFPAITRSRCLQPVLG